MTVKISRLILISMLVGGLCGCFGPGPYYGRSGYAPGYAYAPEYVYSAPYRSGPVYYPQASRPADGYYVHGRGSVRYYNGGEHAWEHPREAQPERRVAPEHHEENH